MTSYPKEGDKIKVSTDKLLNQRALAVGGSITLRLVSNFTVLDVTKQEICCY